MRTMRWSVRGRPNKIRKRIGTEEKGDHEGDYPVPKD